MSSLTNLEEEKILKKNIEIFLKRNNITNDTNINNILLKITRIPTVRTKYIKYYLSNKTFSVTSNKNKECMNNLISLLTNKDNEEHIENIMSNMKLFVKYLSKDDIVKTKNEISDLMNEYQNNKKIYTIFKSFIIILNKTLIDEDSHNRNVNMMLDALLITKNTKRILFYIKKIYKYVNAQYRNIEYEHIMNVFIKILHALISNSRLENTPIVSIIKSKLSGI